MIEVSTLTDGFFSTNTYLVYNKDTLDAIIIDAGADFELIKRQIEILKLNVLGLFLTHGHFDHIMSAKAVQDTAIKVYIHKDDALKLKENKYSFLKPDFPILEADALLEEGELKLGSLTLKVVHTPGHSKGSVCYIIGNAIFTGDTLFRLSIGRSDFTDGSHKDLVKSIKTKIFSLEKNYDVYPGHGQKTTVAFEKKNNSYFKG